jgi:hypothetical protein
MRTLFKIYSGFKYLKYVIDFPWYLTAQIKISYWIPRRIRKKGLFDEKIWDKKAHDTVPFNIR